MKQEEHKTPERDTSGGMELRIVEDFEEMRFDSSSRCSSGAQSPDSGSENNNNSKRRGRPSQGVVKNLILQGSASPSSIKCPDCSRVFPREKSLQAHRRTHTGEKPYACDFPECGKAFTQSGQLKTHQRLHAGEKPFVCSEPGCTVRFTHANRHCPTHPTSALIRSNDCILRPVTGNDGGEQVALWLERYRRDREMTVKGITPKKYRKPFKRSSSESEQENISGHSDEQPAFKLPCPSEQEYILKIETGVDSRPRTATPTKSYDTIMERDNNRTNLVNRGFGYYTEQKLLLTPERNSSDYHRYSSLSITPMGLSSQSNWICTPGGGQEETNGADGGQSLLQKPRPGKLKTRWLEASKRLQFDENEGPSNQSPVKSCLEEILNRPSVLVMASSTISSPPHYGSGSGNSKTISGDGRLEDFQQNIQSSENNMNRCISAYRALVQAQGKTPTTHWSP